MTISADEATTDASQTESAYIAHLWEHPQLCLAIFGIQIHSPRGQELYEESGIPAEMAASLQAAQQDGVLLLTRPLAGPDGNLLLQYWRSWADLAGWARQLPHMAWWRWLLEHAGSDLSFYHEIYQVKSAEAIFEKGCLPVGPAQFVPTSPVASGEGRSSHRQERFQAAAPAEGTT